MNEIENNLILESKFSDMIQKNSWSQDDAMSPENFNQLKRLLKKSVSATIKTIEAYFKKNPDNTWDDIEPLIVEEPDSVFKDEQYLGGTAELVRPFCSLSSKRKIIDVCEITTAICGAKFSKLCGFIFKSKVNTSFPYFWVVYAPKTKNNLSRNSNTTSKYGAHTLSGWYCWKVVGPSNIIIMDDDSMFQEYQFDLAAFLTCDVMKENLPKFALQVRKALASVVPNFIREMPAKGYDGAVIKDAEFKVRCVKDAVDAIENDEMAYNNNHQYRLKSWKGRELSDKT